ncbi:MAG: UDP-N-acetylmuramoyl-tripeptide--D-alanyl-D-alanine ligase [candidate division KSB1 bacterium]|nr:UDP-N-acetylmuramoyl-tripeptide--D-alanyl-D-alanine ligase [candidate division KSB1 bacterium]
MRYRIADILQALPQVMEYVGDERGKDLWFDGLSTDSRTVQPGQMFVALRGVHHDAHAFVQDALERGAVAAVVRRDWFRSGPKVRAPLLVTEDTLDALCRLANFHRRHFQIPVVGLTGTVGKTTAKELIASVLAQKYRVLKSERSYNNAIGLSQTLAKLRPEHEMAVCELGTNHPGEIGMLAEVLEPTAGVILSVGRGHLEFLGDLNGVREEKYALARWLASHDRGPIFLNADDPAIRSCPPAAGRLVWFGQDPRADVRVELAGVYEGRPVLRFAGMEIHLPLAGVHHLTNAAAAVAVGLHFGLTAEEVASGLGRAEAAPHRSQVIRKGGFVVVDDTYNCNPESARAACRLLVSLDGRRKVAVFGDMLELGASSEREHALLGSELRQLGVDVFFGFGQWMVHAVEAARRSGLPARHFADKSKLVEALLVEVRPGDALLFKGSRAMRMEEVLEQFLERLDEAA